MQGEGRENRGKEEGACFHRGGAPGAGVLLCPLKDVKVGVTGLFTAFKVRVPCEELWKDHVSLLSQGR